MKQGWEIKKLGDCLIKVVDNRGKTPPTKSEFEFSYGLLEINSISGNDKFPNYSLIKKFVEKETYDNWFRSGHPQKGDVLVATVGTIGEVAILNENRGCIAQNLIALRSNREILNPDFLFYYLTNPIIKSKLLTLNISYVQPSIRVPHLLKIEIPIPPLPEQRHIVSILDEAFAAIAKAKANAEQNLKNAKELFESYLQVVFEKKGDDWEEKFIREVCDLKSGTTISSNLERSEGDVLYVKVGDMTLPENEVGINTSSRFVNSYEIKSNQIIPNGAIIFPKRGGAIATNKKRKIIKPTIVDLNTMAIIPGNKIDAEYFYHWFQLIDLNSISNGTSIPQINNYSFDDVKIPFPKSKSEQQIIVRQLDALRAETLKLEAVYQKKIDDLEELKKSILQKAFAGELKTEKALAL